MIELPSDQVSFQSFSHLDEVGRVFSWQDRVFRAIYPAWVADIIELMNSGLPQELARHGLMGKVWQTDYKLSGYGVVLEHEVVPAVTYPYEWTFNMFKDAATVMLQVNQIARRFGYQTKDAHGYNLLFYGSQPIFVDLGSLVRLPSDYSGWFGYEEFLQFFLYPLKLWSAGDEFLARRILSGAMQPLMPHESYLMYQFPPARMLKPAHCRRFARLPLLLKNISSMPNEEVKRQWPGRRGELLQLLRLLAIGGGAKLDLTAMVNRVQRLRSTDSESAWGAYQEKSGLVRDGGELLPSPRFGRIVELINRFQIESIVELAGNQGALSRLIVSMTKIPIVICTDYDATSIDSLYRTLGSKQNVLTPAVLDFMSPRLLAETRLPSERMKAQAAMALAVTHHLLLSQKFSIDEILSTICRYAEEYVFIEFMPLGLFDGHSQKDIPDWYNRDWFRDACSRHFRLLLEEQLEENRILFVGRLEN